MTRNLNQIARGLLVTTALLLLAGCTGGMQDLTDWVAEVKERKGAPIEPPPEVKTFETFEYTAHDLRDPFSAGQEEQDAAAGVGLPGPDPTRPKELLESFPLDALDMVGTLGGGADLFALVKDPDGVIHRVRVKNHLGQNYGRIEGVYEDRIDLLELIPNGVGGWMERQVSVALDDE